MLLSTEQKAQLVGEVEQLLSEHTILSKGDQATAWKLVTDLENAIPPCGDSNANVTMGRASQFLRRLLNMTDTPV